MMLHIPNVLTRAQVTVLRGRLEAAQWADGALTAGPQAVRVKQNRQLPADAPEVPGLAAEVLAGLRSSPLYMSAALPDVILTPRFNRYEGGGHYGNHIDGALHLDPHTGQMVRTDVSTTVFFSDPDEYEGGELIVEDSYGAHEVKLSAGDAIVYPASSLHRVEPVTRGTRFAAFLWAQSLVPDDMRRHMLFELDMTIIRLRASIGDSPEVVNLTGLYHNLIRQWARL